MPTPASCARLSTANLVCADYPRPRVAVCLAGAARTLTLPLVHRTIRANLIEAFGGSPTVFAVVKLQDVRNDESRGKPSETHIEPSAEAVHEQPSAFAAPAGLSYEELFECTGGFDEVHVVGAGGFGVVYKSALTMSSVPGGTAGAVSVDYERDGVPNIARAMIDNIHGGGDIYFSHSARSSLGHSHVHIGYSWATSSSRNGAHFQINPNGNVGVNTAGPKSKFQIGESYHLDDTYGQKWMEDPASRTFSEKNYGRALQMMSLINARARAPFLRRGTRSSEL